MDFAPLHTVPEYFQECAEVLNEEWKRSLTARLHSLEKSCDSFPVNLVLLQKDKSGNWLVVGHSRLSNVQGQTTKSCLVESVVVRKSHRGKGYGRTVMEKTEEFASSKGYRTMYLTTHDKQEFYRHLGYEFCSPIVSFDSSIIPEHLAQKLLGNLTLSSEDGSRAKPDSGGCCTAETSKTDTIRIAPKFTPAQQCSGDSSSSHQCNNTNIKQDGSTSHPPAPPPPPVPAAPPPPPLTPSIGKADTNVLDDKTVTRWDPKLVSWMKKTLQH